MVYKIGNPKDIITIPNLSDAETKVISKFANILSDMYGSDRDVDNDYGGYILFAPKGTNPKEFKEFFDYESNIIEYADFYEPNVCSAVYITSTEYGVVLIMSLDDTPETIRKEIQKKTYHIQIKEVLAKVIEIEAQTKADAMNIVKDKYKNGEIVLNADDFAEVEFKEEDK